MKKFFLTVKFNIRICVMLLKNDVCLESILRFVNIFDANIIINEFVILRNIIILKKSENDADYIKMLSYSESQQNNFFNELYRINKLTNTEIEYLDVFGLLNKNISERWCEYSYIKKHDFRKTKDNDNK